MNTGKNLPALAVGEVQKNRTQKKTGKTNQEIQERKQYPPVPVLRLTSARYTTPFLMRSMLEG
jgi:hypothetical protein